MAIRNLRYEGDEILSKRAREIEVIDDKIRELAKDMFDTMQQFEGVGLAGPQDGILRAKEVVVEALNLDGKKVKIKGKDLLAQALQHEIDHLNGEVFVNKCEAGTLETLTADERQEKRRK